MEEDNGALGARRRGPAGGRGAEPGRWFCGEPDVLSPAISFDQPRGTPENHRSGSGPGSGGETGRFIQDLVCLPYGTSSVPEVQKPGSIHQKHQLEQVLQWFCSLHKAGSGSEISNNKGSVWVLMVQDLLLMSGVVGMFLFRTLIQNLYRTFTENYRNINRLFCRKFTEH